MKQAGISFMKIPVIVVLAFCLYFPASAQAAEPLKVGVLDFPPFYIVKSETDVTGSMTDVIRKTLDKAGIKYVLSGLPPKRLYKNLTDGTTDIWMGIKGVPDYEGHVLYSDIETQEIEIRLYTLKDKPLLKSLDELKGKKVIIQRGYGYGGMIKFLEDPNNNITLDPTDGHDLAFKKLLKGRSDYVLDYKQPAEATIAKEKFTGLAYSSLKSLKIQFIVSKKTPDAANLLKKIDAAYLALKKSGAFK
jgi:polar amino acid transport system substrate-binding protein